MSILGHSLRLRLLVLILCPLILVSILATYWRFDSARDTAEDIFDKNLIILCLAVSRDVANSGGDTLSETTANMFREASGGSVFYHVNGPDGSFVTGYSSPPVRRADVALIQNTPLLFDAQHQGKPVRVASLAERVEIDGIAGVSVVTVWQQLEPRTAFAQTLAMQAAMLALVLVITVAGLVIFGVRLGLRPLDELEAAIQKRSTTDLRPIERQIPIEAKGIVDRLNSLFINLTEAKSAQERLISNAAHQLRNPVAAIHTMAQATLAAKTLDDSKIRAMELVSETRRAVRLTQQMLSLEKIRGGTPDLTLGDLNDFMRKISERIGSGVLKADVAFELSLTDVNIETLFDPLLLGEAITNIVDNALQHAGPTLSVIKISTALRDGKIYIMIENDGILIGTKTSAKLFERFKQGTESHGAGLGLSIAEEIVKLHKGTIILTTQTRTVFSIILPTTS